MNFTEKYIRHRMSPSKKSNQNIKTLIWLVNSPAKQLGAEPRCPFLFPPKTWARSPAIIQMVTGLLGKQQTVVSAMLWCWFALPAAASPVTHCLCAGNYHNYHHHCHLVLYRDTMMTPGTVAGNKASMWWTSRCQSSVKLSHLMTNLRYLKASHDKWIGQ